MRSSRLSLGTITTAVMAMLLVACSDFDVVQELSRFAHPKRAEQPAPRPAPTHNVLFIGNSLTFVNDLPALVRNLDASIATESVTAGGIALSDHWNAGRAASKISQGHYTHVVLQERTYEPLTNPTGFHDYAGRFATAARAAGAKPVIFEAWAHRDQSDEMYLNAWSGGSPDAMQELLLGQVRSAAQETSALVALPGEAFRQSHLVHPEIELYAPDGNHPSVAGTYLAACVIVQLITGSPPAGGSPSPAGLSQDAASALQRAAQRAAENQ